MQPVASHSERPGKLSQNNVRGLVLAFLAVGLPALLAYVVLADWPRYIVLEGSIEGLRHWGYTQRAVLISESTGDQYFVWRAEGKLFPEDFSGAGVEEAMMASFDRFLHTQGWERFDDGGFSDPCTRFLPETRFLDRDAGYVQYLPAGTESYTLDHPVTCLAIWPVPIGIGWNVVLTTLNPSFWTVLRRD